MTTDKTPSKLSMPGWLRDAAGAPPATDPNSPPAKIWPRLLKWALRRIFKV